MPDAAQYTLGLFDSSALGWTVPTPTASPVSADADADDEPQAPAALTLQEKGVNFALSGDRQLARGWPARARRTASDTACTAEACPITREPSSASMRSSLPVSPSSSRPAGIPVQADTTSATSSARWNTWPRSRRS